MKTLGIIYLIATTLTCLLFASPWIRVIIKKHFLKLIVLLLLFNASCVRSEENLIEDIKYFKDDKSGLCFAKVENGIYHASNYSISITCVPCNNVQHLIEN